MEFLKKYLPFFNQRTESAFVSLNLHSTMSGEVVSPETSLTESTVYGCLRIISSNIGTLPLFPYQKTSNGRSKLEDIKLYNLFTKSPNSRMTAAEWKQATVTQMLLYGNSYSYVDYLGSEPIGIWLL